MHTHKLDHIWDSPRPDGTLDPDTIDDIDIAAGELVEAVHSGGTADVDRIMRGMDWVHLAALALSVATLAEPAGDTTRDGLGWTIAHMRAAHAAYQGGDQRQLTREGELQYQRLMARQRRVRVVGPDERAVG